MSTCRDAGEHPGAAALVLLPKLEMELGFPRQPGACCCSQLTAERVRDGELFLPAGCGCGELAGQRSGGAWRSLPLLSPPQLHHQLQPLLPLLGAGDELGVVELQGFLRKQSSWILTECKGGKGCDGHGAGFSERLLK